MCELADLDALHAELERLKPAELLLPEDRRGAALARDAAGVRQRPPWHFDPGTGKRLLCEQLGTRDLAGFDAEDALAAVGAAGCLLQYVKDTQRAACPISARCIGSGASKPCIIDAQTRRNLELEASLGAAPELTLAGLMDRCSTAMGSRHLRRWLNRPIRDRAELKARQQAIEALKTRGALDAITDVLKEVGDLERVLTRVGAALGAAARSRAAARRARYLAGTDEALRAARRCEAAAA